MFDHGTINGGDLRVVSKDHTNRFSNSREISINFGDYIIVALGYLSPLKNKFPKI